MNTPPPPFISAVVIAWVSYAYNDVHVQGINQRTPLNRLVHVSHCISKLALWRNAFSYYMKNGGGTAAIHIDCGATSEEWKGRGMGERGQIF
jgi:hypothetical protein